MNWLECIMRLAVAAAAGVAVTAALPASQGGSRPARLVVAGATGAACLELIAAANVPLESPLLWTFTRMTAPLAWLLLLAGVVSLLRAAPASPRPDPASSAPVASPPPVAPSPRPSPLVAPNFLRPRR